MKTSLHPVVFEIDPQIRLAGGPRFSNTALEDSNRDAQSNIMWDTPKWEWSLKFVGESEMMYKITSFFNARCGSAYGWLFSDPFDYRATIEDGSGWVKTAADGKRYLTKIYADPINPLERRIRCPVLGSISWGDIGGNPEVDQFTGEVTGAENDGPCSFDFYCPVRFAIDFLQLEREPGDSGSEWSVLVQEIGKFYVDYGSGMGSGGGSS